MTAPSPAPRVSSREAAVQHARLLAAGRPRDRHLVVALLALSLVGAAATVAVAAVVAVFLAVLAVALGGVVLGDRRSAWRYADTGRRARLLGVAPSIPRQPGPVGRTARAPRQVPVAERPMRPTDVRQ